MVVYTASKHMIAGETALNLLAHPADHRVLRTALIVGGLAAAGLSIGLTLPMWWAAIVGMLLGAKVGACVAGVVNGIVKAQLAEQAGPNVAIAHPMTQLHPGSSQRDAA